MLYFNMTALWTAHPDYPEHVKIELETRVRSLPPSFLLAPINGEVFENADVCHERLQGWAFSQGFAVVRTSGSLKQKQPRFEFQCIHYGVKTSDTYKLENHVEEMKKVELLVAVSRRPPISTLVAVITLLFSHISRLKSVDLAFTVLF